jgi:hypothetical protein
MKTFTLVSSVVAVLIVAFLSLGGVAVSEASVGSIEMPNVAKPLLDPNSDQGLLSILQAEGYNKPELRKEGLIVFYVGEVVYNLFNDDTALTCMYVGKNYLRSEQVTYLNSRVAAVGVHVDEQGRLVIRSYIYKFERISKNEATLFLQRCVGLPIEIQKFFGRSE